MSLEDNVEVRPEILCIGDIHELKYQQWIKTKEGDGYKLLKRPKIAHKMSALPGMFYFLTV